MSPSRSAFLLSTALLLSPAHAQVQPFGLVPALVPALLSLTASPPPTRAPVTTERRVRDFLAAAFREQLEGEGLDRHRLRHRLELANPEPVADTIIIAFHGTGAFSPRVAPAMLRLRDYEGELPTRSLGAVVRLAHEDVYGEQPPLAVVLAGPMDWLLRDRSLTPGGFAWRSYPSEEVEALGGVDNALDTVAREGIREALTIEREPPAQAAARAYLLGALARARAQGKSPRVVVLSHSSGGRAAVRFVASLRRTKDPRTGEAPLMVDLGFTLDPVRQAHLAAEEILSGGVASREDRRVLYKPANARRWVSAYQTTDTRSLGTGPVRVGIHGSPVHGADRELHFEMEDAEDAAGAHMTQYKHEPLRELFEEEMKALAALPDLPAPPAATARSRAGAFYLSFLASAGPGEAGKLTGGHNDYLEGLRFGRAQDPEGFRALERAIAGNPRSRPLSNLVRRWVAYRRDHAGERALAEATAGVRRQVTQYFRGQRQAAARS